MAALYLADRHQPDASSGPAAAEAAPVVSDEPAWRWRRPPSPREEQPAEQPLELTVGPAKPFTSLGDDRDKPGPS
jgi:hypothetical protein